MTEAKQDSRRNFLKIGAGVVVGAVVAGAAVAAYDSGVIGSNNSSSSSTVSSLSDELSSTQAQLTDTQNSLSAAQGTISTLSGQLANAQSSLSAANSQNTSLNSQLASTQYLVDEGTGFMILSATEQSLLGAIAEALIPNDGSGPDANAAGVIYFIDRQLATDYGKSAHMYMLGPFVPPNQTASITINDRDGNAITYSGGSTLVTVESGMQYQYHVNLHEFFRYGLDAFQTYSNSAYGGNFETLSSANQLAALTDLYNNKPTTFNNLLPSDFFYELFVMIWSGYFMDPLYGGNKGMAAWVFSAFNGVNMGDFYGEGYTTKELMLATTPIQLQPASLGQYQKGSP